MNSFLSIFLLCTKTHKNIPTEIDFRSIVFRCKYNQSVKERPGYSSFSLAVWVNQELGQKGGRGGRGGLSGGWWFLSESRLGVVGQQFL